MLKFYKYRIYPTDDQKVYLDKVLLGVRFVYNNMLSDIIKICKKEETEYPTLNKYKEKYKWLNDIDDSALDHAKMDLDKVCRKFQKNMCNDFSELKPKDNYILSYTTDNKNDSIKIEGKFIKIPSLKSNIKIVLHRKFEGVIKSATICKFSESQYYISFLVENSNIKYKSKVEGIASDLDEIIFRSYDKEVNNLDSLEQRLKKLYKDLDRKEGKSNNREKVKFRINKLKQRIFNFKKDFLHKLSFEMVNKSEVIDLNDLKNRINKSDELVRIINKEDWIEFEKMLKYKMRYQNKEIINSKAMSN